MKKSLAALAAAALMLAAAGCSAATTESSSPSGTPGSSSPTVSAPAGTGTATATPAPVPLAEDFPADRIPVMDGAEILSSTVDRAGQTVTSVLVASSTEPAADILAFYDAALTGQGFTASPAAGDAPSSRDYVRAGAEEPETVNVTVISKDGGRSTITVGSTLISETDNQP